VTYCAYHIKQSLWYTQAFCWVTGTILFLDKGLPIYAGIALGILYISGLPRYSLYFSYLLIGYWILHPFNLIVLPIALSIGGYQIYTDTINTPKKALP